MTILLAGAMMIATAVPALPTLPDEAAGWKAAAPARRYDRQTIFEYIDGHGEVYLAYGMTACDTRRYAGPEGEGEVVVDVFDMATPADAFGVYTHSREGDPADVGQGGSYGYGTLFFWKGRYFVSVYAERESGRARGAVMALGRAVAASVGETGEAPALARRLPRAGLDETSLVYLRHPRILEAHVPVGPDNPLGVGPQAPAVTGRYRTGGGAADLVVVEYPDEATAEAAAAGFAARFLDGERPARGDDGWRAAATLAPRVRAYVLRAPSREAALLLLAEGEKGASP
ncbi:MAG TPA: DUF6599 family protein [Vicinamibacteria bacterium]|nr:DUF6599 family protein [Vicinamibacteria bacterium]